MSLSELEAALETLKTELDRVRPASDQLDKAGKAIEELIPDLRRVGGNIGVLSQKLLEVAEQIARVDFPSRLDKMDSSITAINIGLQNAQSGQRELGSRLSEKSSGELSKVSNSISAEGQKTRKRITILSSALLLLLVVDIALSVLFRLNVA